MKPETRIYIFVLVALLVQFFIVLKNKELEKSAQDYYNACQIAIGENHV
jgi:hypothetical protein